MKKEALRASCVVPMTPHAVYCAWLDSGQHTAFTGGKAVVIADVGANFTAWDGYIQGKNVQLDLGRRIVQSWRTTDFPKGAPDSRLEIHFEPVFDGTRVTILHSEIPEGQGEKYKSGWNEKYFMPMRAYFGKMAMKADRASMVRMQQRASEPAPVAAEQSQADSAAKLAKKPRKGPSTPAVAYAAASTASTAPNSPPKAVPRQTLRTPAVVVLPTKASAPANAAPAQNAPAAKASGPALASTKASAPLKSLKTVAAPAPKSAVSKSAKKVTPPKAAKTAPSTPKNPAKSAKKPAPAKSAKPSKAAKKAAPKPAKSKKPVKAVGKPGKKKKK